MTWTTLTALVLSLVAFVSFGWAIRWLFRVPGRMPTQMKWLTVLGLAFFVGQWVAILCAQPHLSFLTGAGLLLYVLSLAVFWWATPYARRAALHIAFSDHSSGSLITSGPYRWIRHPFYASYFGYWIAGVIVSQQPWLLVSVAVMGGFYVAAIRREERELLAGPLAGEYAAYRVRTGALLPKPWARGGSA